MKEKGVITAALFVLLIYSAIFTFLSPNITANIVNEPKIVAITANGFEPAEITINSGESVTWTNEHSYTHVLFSPTFEERFTTPEIKPGTTFTHIYSALGEFKYYEVNWGFKGEVVVKAAQQEIIEKKEIEEKEECAICADGCTNNETDCSKCVCPCYTDEDCDDKDECTLDICQASPVKCEYVKIENCGQAMIPLETITKKPNTNTLFIGGFLALVAMVLAFLVFRIANKNPSPEK